MAHFGPRATDELDAALAALLAAVARVRATPDPPATDDDVTKAIRVHTDLVGATSRMVQVVARTRSELVRRLVHERTMTVTEIAERMGRSRQYVQRLRDRAELNLGEEAS
jgi:hypothetical protein